MTTSKNIGTFISSDCNSEATPHRSWKGKVIKFLFVGLFLSLSLSQSLFYTHMSFILDVYQPHSFLSMDWLLMLNS